MNVNASRISIELRKLLAFAAVDTSAIIHFVLMKHFFSLIHRNDFTRNLGVLSTKCLRLTRRCRKYGSTFQMYPDSSKSISHFRRKMGAIISIASKYHVPPTYWYLRMLRIQFIRTASFPLLAWYERSFVPRFLEIFFAVAFKCNKNSVRMGRKTCNTSFWSQCECQRAKWSAHGIDELKHRFHMRFCYIVNQDHANSVQRRFIASMKFYRMPARSTTVRQLGKKICLITI